MQTPKNEPDLKAAQDKDQPFRVRVLMSDGGAHVMVLLLSWREARDVAREFDRAADAAYAHETKLI